MLNSMTAFAKCDKQNQFGYISFEIRTVNHRYLEMGFRLPDSVSSIEAALRDKIRHYIQRGRCDITLRYQPSIASNKVLLNLEIAEDLLKNANILAKKSDLPVMLNITDILRWPGVQQAELNNNEDLHSAIINVFVQAMEMLVQERQREGKLLHGLLLQKLEAICKHFSEIKQLIPQMLPKLQTKVITRLAELKVMLDNNRLEQELVYLANKMDVEEEIDRIQMHTNELQKILIAGGVIGRRLDFLLQELHREVNTLGTKAPDKHVTQYIIDIKVLIEQMREQVQNVE